MSIEDEIMAKQHANAWPRHPQFDCDTPTELEAEVARLREADATATKAIDTLTAMHTTAAQSAEQWHDKYAAERTAHEATKRSLAHTEDLLAGCNESLETWQSMHADAEYAHEATKLRLSAVSDTLQQRVTNDARWSARAEEREQKLQAAEQRVAECTRAHEATNASLRDAEMLVADKERLLRNEERAHEATKARRNEAELQRDTLATALAEADEIRAGLEQRVAELEAELSACMKRSQHNHDCSMRDAKRAWDAEKRVAELERERDAAVAEAELARRAAKGGSR